MVKIIREHRKSIVIKISDTLEIIVKAPYSVSEQKIYELIENKKIFIERARAHQQERNKAKGWFANKKLLFLGEDRAIIIKKVSESNARVYLEENQLYVVTCLDEEENIKNVVEQWAKQCLSEIVTKLTIKYCELIQCEYNKITIRKQKTRWGSCSSKGNLSYNIKLICTPLEVIEYVVLHEVMHLKHFDHSKQFWESIAQIMPEYRKCEDYLRKYGSCLEI